MGLKEAKREVVIRLRKGFVQHAIHRSGKIELKNLLLTGEVSVEEVIRLISLTKGSEYESKPHHFFKSLEVHIFKPKKWYIKCYFIDPDVIFISVHR